MRGIQLVPYDTKIDFVGLKNITYAISILIMIVSITSVMLRGFNFGIDFRGGYLFKIEVPAGQDISMVRAKFAKKKDAFGDVKLQGYGDSLRNIMIRLEINDELGIKGVKSEVRKLLGAGVKYQKVDVIGAKVSGELITKSAYGLLIAVICMLIYIWLRFEWHFSAGAVAAQLHDVIIVIGAYSILGLEFNEKAIIAILTTLGYSINDTVVIYDRIRENLRILKHETIPQLVNISTNETLSRTTLTSVTTVLSLLALYLFGGEVIEGFVLPIMIGIIAGTYSSIFVAAPLLITLDLDRDHLEKSDDEEENDDPTVTKERDMF